MTGQYRTGKWGIVLALVSIACSSVPKRNSLDMCVDVHQACGIVIGDFADQDQAVCVARSYGMSEGLCGLYATPPHREVYKRRPVWVVSNVLVRQGQLGCPCGSSGEAWYISDDGEVVLRSKWIGGCVS